MLNLHKLKLNNFWSYKSAEINFTYDSPVLVLGDNQQSDSADSNGAGKSSLFLSILWALFGKTGTGGTQDSVVNNIAGRDCVVELTGDCGGVPFKITRYRLHAKFKNEVFFTFNGKDCRMKNNSETQDSINTLLKLDLETLMQTSYFNPSATSLFCAMTDSGQKDIFHNLLNLQVFDVAYSDTKDAIKGFENLDGVYKDRLMSAESQRQSELTNFKLFKDKYKVTTQIDYVEKATTMTNSLLELLDSRGQLPEFDEDMRTKVSNSRVILKNSIKTLEQLPDVCGTCGQDVDKAVTDTQRQEFSSKLSKLDDVFQKLNEDKTRWEAYNEATTALETGVSELVDMYEEADRSRLVSSFAETHIKKLREYDIEIKGYKDSLNNIAKKLGLSLELKRAFSKNGIKAETINALLPLLNDKIDYYAKELLGGSSYISIRLKDNKFETNISGNSYASLSSGEKRRVDIAVMLGFNDVLVHLNLNNNFLILDELMENLDATAKEKIVSLLASISNDNINNIFIITHDNDLKGYFDNRIIVSKDRQGYTTVDYTS